MSGSYSTFYFTGGTLRPDAASYVERKADKELLDRLLKGEFCYVLTSRQMGKSSLMVRTAMKLREQGVRVIALDLTAIGQNLEPEQWYHGLLDSIGAQLDLEDELEQFWGANGDLGPLQRLKPEAPAHRVVIAGAVHEVNFQGCGCRRGRNHTSAPGRCWSASPRGPPSDWRPWCRCRV